MDYSQNDQIILNEQTYAKVNATYYHRLIHSCVQQNFQVTHHQHREDYIVMLEP